MKNNFLLVLLISFFASTFCYSQFTVSGEFRPRTEYRHGFKTLASENQDAAFFIDQRTRLNLDFKINSIQTYFSLQNIHVWGDQPQLVTNNGAALGIHEAWAKVKLNQNWGLKLGRQEIAYDDQRIFGSVNWAQQARSHDAALLVFQDSTFTGHLGLAFNQDRPQLVETRYTVPRNYKTIQFLWLRKEWNTFKASLLFLNNGVQVNYSNGDFETNFSQTIGGRLSWKQNKLSANLAAYYQGGTNPDTLDSDIKAHYLGADIGYSISENFSVGGGIEILSGNDQLDNNGENNAFNPFYGTNHKFNGVMDYFYVGNHAGSVGLNDVFIRGNYKNKKFETGIAFHVFQANSDITDGNGGALDAALGTEIDYTIGFKLKPGASLKLGYSQLFGTDSMEALKGGDSGVTNNWGWAMIIIKPSHTFKINK